MITMLEFGYFAVDRSQLSGEARVRRAMHAPEASSTGRIS
jgi:hypothetical protein